MLVGVLTNNLNRVLVGTYCTVGTKTEELALLDRLSTESHFLNLWERSKCNVVNDTNSEVVLWLWQLEVVEYRDNLGWSNV